MWMCVLDLWLCFVLWVMWWVGLCRFCVCCWMVGVWSVGFGSLVLCCCFWGEICLGRICVGLGRCCLDGLIFICWWRCWFLFGCCSWRFCMFWCIGVLGMGLVGVDGVFFWLWFWCRVVWVGLIFVLCGCGLLFCLVLFEFFLLILGSLWVLLLFIWMRWCLFLFLL